MPSATAVAKILFLLGVTVSGSAEGTLAYYHDASIRNVCQHRTANGWNDLNCAFPCQVASINNHVGEYWLVALPNCRGKTEYRLCLVVDCGRKEDIESLRAKGEIAEISGELANYCGYETYINDAIVWRLNVDYIGWPRHEIIMWVLKSLNRPPETLSHRIIHYR